MSMDQITSSPIYCYLRNECKDVVHKSSDTCEDVCTILCKEFGISPVTRLLFSLRLSGTNNWLPGSRTLKSNVQYDFRLRYKIPKVSNLKLLDKIAYNYFYHQVRSDVLNSRVPEIVYPKYKDQILGLCVTDMYREMIENNRSVLLLTKFYRDYIPRELEKNHKIFVKRKIETMLRSIKKKEHDADYVKGIYLEEFAKMAPNYMTEEVEGITSYLKEDELKQGTCPVRIEFSPFHNEQPGLRIYYSYKQMWKLISQIEDIYAIIVDKSDVTIEMKDAPAGFRIQIADKEQRESFVTCVAGYYRLMVKWNIDLCRNYQSPSLAKLRSIKCHGPIGGEFSYKKIEEKSNNSLGAFIVRQCEREYDTYYIDIVTKGNQPETLKITNDSDQWWLHVADTPLAYDELMNLVQHIPDKPKKLLRISPTEYDKPPLLLLCLPSQALIVKKTVIDMSELNSVKPRIISASEDLLLFKDSQQDDEGGCFTRMRGEWKLPADKKLEVTLKILKAQKIDKHLLDFMSLTDKWCKLDSNEIVRIYGITLQQPIAMVMESINLGPLDVFLRQRSREQVGFVCLIDAAYALVRALHYLQERKIIHGRIRCSTLQVAKFEAKTNLVVKLGDPGFARPLTKSDVPWIPVEYFDHLDGAKGDLKAEIWAATTTLWEIFSRGAKIDRIDKPKEFFAHGCRLPPPDELRVDSQEVRELYGIMREGWDADPDKRFSPQLIFARLISARENFSRPYDLIGTSQPRNRPYIPTDNSTIGSKHSLVSNETDETYVRNGDSYSFVSNGSELRSNHSNSSTISESSYTNGTIPTYNTNSTMNSGSSGLTLLASCSEVHANEYLDNIPYALEWDDCRIVFCGEIGKGNYGKVYLGQLEDNQNHVVEVALKTFNLMPSAAIVKDLNREAGIMKRLNHPNIVKILGFVDNPRIIIVMEHIKHSSFDKYLCSKAPNITTQILLKFAKDIASGMGYLQEQNIIHRDLAARNILVASEDCVKISDFGLAQAADSNGYYMMRNSRDLPIKWYAPESLRTGKYSFKSDVWSYGITVFEMFSRGRRPELVPGHDLTSDELLELLESGKRLAMPPLCPERIYNFLMLQCWHEVPSMRPTFTNLLDTIDNLVQEFGESI